MTDANKDVPAVEEKSIEEKFAELEAKLAKHETAKAEDAKTKSALLDSYQRPQNSDEKKLLNTFRCKGFDELIKTNVADPRFARVAPDLKHQVLTLKENIDVARFMEQMFGDGTPDTKNKFGKIGFNSTAFGREIMDQVKSFGSGVVGGGAEWIPTLVATTAIEEYELERQLAAMFKQVNMPSNPYKLPKQDGVTKARSIAENTGMTDSSFGTSDILFDAFKLGEFYRIPEELQEDSAVDLLRMARNEIILAQDRAFESLILNGDTTAPHMDADTEAGAADLAEKTVKGLRKLSLENAATVDFGAAVVSEAKMNEMRRLMGKLGVNVRELAYIFGASSYFQATELPNVSTVEKFGPHATILNGSLAAYRGIKIAISEYCRDDVSATGLNTGVADDFGVCHLVNASRFYFAKRRPIVVKAMMDMADQDRWLLASYSRVDFKGHVQSADEVSAVTGINILI